MFNHELKHQLNQLKEENEKNKKGIYTSHGGLDQRMSRKSRSICTNQGGIGLG